MGSLTRWEERITRDTKERDRKHIPIITTDLALDHLFRIKTRVQFAIKHKSDLTSLFFNRKICSTSQGSCNTNQQPLCCSPELRTIKHFTLVSLQKHNLSFNSDAKKK